MSRKIPVNMTREQRLALVRGQPVRGIQTITLGGPAAEVVTSSAQPTAPSRPPAVSRRTETHVNYADEYRKEEYKRFVQGDDSKGGTDRRTCSASQVTNSHMESLEVESSVGLPHEPTPLRPVPDDEESLTKLYSEYNLGRNFDPLLSITKYREQILETIDNRQVTIIQGGTGCGKSTQVCQFILDHYASMTKYCNIVVTQPRRIAAISVAKRVCAENQWKLGSICGYQVGLDREASVDTRILFCTVGVFLRKLISVKSLNQYTHVLLDEVHERGQDTDLTLLVVRKLLRTVSPNVRVVLMSATLELPLYKSYLKYKNSHGAIEDPTVIEVRGHTYDVAEMYLDDMKHLGKPFPEMDLFAPKVHQELIDIAVMIILTCSETEKSWNMTSKGSVLVFLPGYEDIDNMKNALEQYESAHNLVIRTLHSAVPVEEQVKVFETVKQDQRKVILSTNIAESSITVSDIKYVIDFCLTKVMMSDLQTNYSSLQLQWASKSSCAQRKGRAGRVTSGIVYRMVHYHFFQKLEDFDIPEILRCPLDQLVLKSKLLDMGKPKAVLALALNPPDLRNIEKTILILKEVGALSPEGCDPHDGALTYMGRILAMLPMDTHLGKLIVLGHVIGFLEEAITISALHCVPTIFVHPPKGRLEAYQSKMKWSNHSESDSLASYFAYMAWEHMKRIQKLHSFRDEIVWCRNQFLDYRRLKEVRVLIEEVKNRLKMDFQIDTPAGNRPPDLKESNSQFLIKVLMCGAFYPNFFVTSPIDEDLALRDTGGYDPQKTVVVRGLPDGGGFFYRKDLRALFRGCDTHKVEPKIHCQNTRAYIEFQGRKDDSNVSLAVCSALKMRLFKMPLYVNYDASEPIGDGEDEEDGCNVQWTARSEEKHGPRQVELPTVEKKFWAIAISEVLDCGHFWGTYCDPLRASKNCTMHISIQRWVSNNPPGTLKEVKVGSYCLAPFRDTTGNTEYYRAKIIRRELTNVEVFYLDYGNCSVVGVDKILPLYAAFLSNPFQAMEFQLAHIRPSLLKTFNSRQWSDAAKSFFKNFVNSSGTFNVEVFSIVDGVVRVKLFHPNDPETDVGCRLVSGGHAEWQEENSISKENNKNRNRSTITIKRNLWDSGDEEDDKDQATVEDWYKGVTKSVPGKTRESNWAIAVKKSEMTAARDVKRKNQLRQILLVGPSNPLELRFSSLSASKSPGMAKIERDSVNSVVICSDPSNQVMPMMVSAFVGLTPNNNMLIVRDSTLLPPIRGLLSLVTLLFTPIAEYRTDKDLLKFTGALCGLGFYSDSPESEPMLAENDIEIQFDMTFDYEDHKMINDFRTLMNLMISGEVYWRNSNLLKLQDQARKKLLELLCRPRDAINAESFWRPNCWNMIAQKDLIPQPRDKCTIFLPHAGIRLKSHILEKLQRGSGSLSQELKQIHHDILLQEANLRDASQEDRVFHCRICNESLIGPARLSIHLSLKSHLLELQAD